MEQGKVMAVDGLSAVVKSRQKNGEKVVFTNGCFDILHRGHVTYLQQARELGDVLVVGMNSDASVKRLKGDERPIHPEADRAFMLTSLRWVDYVVIYDEDTPVDTLGKLRPDVLVKGGDYTIEQIVGGDLVQSYGGEVYSLSCVDGFSTTNIVESIRNSK